MQRAVTFTYLLWSENQNADRCTASEQKRVRKGNLQQSQSIDELSDSSSHYRGEVFNNKDYIGLWEQLDTLKSLDPESVETFQMAASFVWQKSQWIWDGTISGATCHHGAYDSTSELKQILTEETTVALFQNIGVIAALVRSYARWWKSKSGTVSSLTRDAGEALSLRATEITKKASETAKQLIEVGQDPEVTVTGGYWNQVSYLEHITSSRLDRSLRSWESCIATCYELGITVPTLPSQYINRDDLKVAALMFKRTITDLRVVWKAVSSGYTSQAAAIAAGLFEHALLTSSLAGSDKRTARILADPQGPNPWDVRCMCGFEIERWFQESNDSGDKVDLQSPAFKKSVDDLYSQYQYLCKIKHPTLEAASYLSGSTQMPNGYVIMAAPDMREEDLSLKNYVLLISVNRCFGATSKFFKAMYCDEKDSQVIRFCERLDDLSETIGERTAHAQQSPLPFSL